MKEFYIKIHLPGIEPGPLAWKARILTTRRTGQKKALYGGKHDRSNVFLIDSLVTVR